MAGTGTLAGRTRPLPPLSLKEARFAYAYAENGGNATRAFLKAGYTARTLNAAGVRAHRLLRKTKVRQAIDDLMRAKVATPHETMARLSLHAFADRSAILDCLVNEETVTEEQQGDTKVITRTIRQRIDPERLRQSGLGPLITGLQPTKHGLSVKLTSPIESLQTLAKFHGLLVDRHEHRVLVGVDLDRCTLAQLREIEAGRIPPDLPRLEGPKDAG